VRDEGVEIRMKGDYKNSIHRSIARLGQFMFWVFRNWYETSIPLIFLALYYLPPLFGLWSGPVYPASISVGLLALFEVLRYFEVGRSEKTFDDFFTTILGVIYVPTGWEEWIDDYGWAGTIRQSYSFHKIIRHEMVHVYQRQDWGNLRYLAGYIVPPILITFRAIPIELDGYTQNLIMAMHKNPRNKVPEEERDFVASQLSGPNYLFMFTPEVFLWLSAISALFAFTSIPLPLLVKSIAFCLLAFAPLPWINGFFAKWVVDRRADQVEEGEYKGLAPYRGQRLKASY